MKHRNRLTSFILTAMLMMPLASLRAAKVADLPGEKSKDISRKTATLKVLLPRQNIAGAATTANKVTRLQLELVKTESAPVIGANHPDARDLPAGFEAGTTVKVTIDGKSTYHMVSTTMETFGATRWANMRTEHWISEDGNTWRRHKILFRPGTNPETGMWELTGSPFFFFDEKEDRWFVYFNFMAYDRIRPWSTPTLLRRAGAKTNGADGINGEFDYPGEIVAPSGVAHPTDAAASSISPPFQADCAFLVSASLKNGKVK